jgi:hypothetical protein
MTVRAAVGRAVAKAADTARAAIPGRRLGRVAPGELLIRRLPGGGRAYYRQGEPGEPIYTTEGDGITCPSGHSNKLDAKRCAVRGCRTPTLTPPSDAPRLGVARAEMARAERDAKRVRDRRQP